MTKSAQHHDYITPKIAEKSGISKFKFYKYVKENGLEPVSHGIYSTGTNWIDELYILHQRCPNAVFSHDEAAISSEVGAILKLRISILH